MCRDSLQASRLLPLFAGRERRIQDTAATVLVVLILVVARGTLCKVRDRCFHKLLHEPLDACPVYRVPARTIAVVSLKEKNLGETNRDRKLDVTRY